MGHRAYRHSIAYPFYRPVYRRRPLYRSLLDLVRTALAEFPEIDAGRISAPMSRGVG